MHDGLNIDWVGGKPPVYEPECGFNNERCIKERGKREAAIVMISLYVQY